MSKIVGDLDKIKSYSNGKQRQVFLLRNAYIRYNKSYTNFICSKYNFQALALYSEFA